MINLNFDQHQLKDFCQNNNISFLGVFGSIARGEATPQSDLDLLVEFSKTPGLIKFVGLEQQLSEMLGKKVDLLTRDAISPYLRERILAETKPIYEQKR